MSSKVKIYLNEQGQLIFDACDSGPEVKSLQGDYDYEYGYIIEPDQVDKLFKFISLEEIKNKFPTSKSYLEFGQFLKDNQIKYKNINF